MRALSGAAISLASTEIIGSPAISFLGGAVQTANDNLVRGGVTFSGTGARLIDNMITGAVPDGEPGITNCRENYDEDLIAVGC